MKIRNVAGELGRYLVQSESNPDQEYLVDLLEHPLNGRCCGKCGCVDWQVRRQPRLAMAVEVDPTVQCKHVQHCFERFGQEMAFQIQADQQKRAFTKTKK